MSFYHLPSTPSPWTFFYWSQLTVISASLLNQVKENWPNNPASPEMSCLFASLGSGSVSLLPLLRRFNP